MSQVTDTKIRFERRRNRSKRNNRSHADRYRLVISRSTNHISAQIIDDHQGATLAAASTKDKSLQAKLKKASNKVGIVTGGGSGHLPVFTGYVGKGFLDACAIGSVFASPSVEQMTSAIRNADNGNGVLCVLGNYG